MSAPLVTRFAPSPTGSLHLGNARTAFFSYLWARKAGGRFILRIEDTDMERSEARFRDALLVDLGWLGLKWDEGPEVGGPHGPYAQSERHDIYAASFATLAAQEAVYPCYCTAEELELSRKLQRMAGKPPRYAGTCRHLTVRQRAERAVQVPHPTLRFAVPENAVVQFEDLVHGPQSFAAADLGDFIVRRENGSAAFFFSNAVDDSLMGVTHVLRGDDHLTNTPRQLLLLDALRMRRPAYGHLGLLTGADGAPLSKRHGSASVADFRARGFLSEALLNHLFHLGHAGGIDHWQPSVTMPGHFQPDHLGRAPARFDETQLVHWQKETLQRMSATDLRHWAGVAESTEFIELVRHNVILPADFQAWAAVIDGALPPLEAPEQNIIAEAGPAFFNAAVEALGASNGAPDMKQLARHVRERTGRKGADLFMPLRVALTGRSHGPELAALVALMTPGTARRRLESYAEDPQLP